MSSPDSLMRIPQNVIDDLVSQTDIVGTIGRYLKLSKQGKDYVALCPFHKEMTPSFSVSPSKQFYYCFGCGSGGNAMNFLMEFQGRGFLPVLQEMAEDCHVDINPYLKMAAKDQIDFQILPALKQATTLFQTALRMDSAGKNPAKAYLLERQIPDALVTRFAIGYAGNGRNIVEKLQDHQQPLIEAGVLDKGKKGVFSLFRDRLVLPIRDTRGKIVALSGRTLDDEIKPKYRNTKETALFSKNSLLYGLYESLQMMQTDKLDRLFIVEGQFDVIGCHIEGIPAAAPMGSSLSLQQLRLIMRHSDRVTFVFDGDEAGLKAVVQVAELILTQITDMDMQLDMLILSNKEDPHSIITTDPKRFHTLTETTIDWMDALFAYLPSAQDLSTERHKSAFAADALDIIHGARDPLIRYQAMEKVAMISNIPSKVLNDRLEIMPQARAAQTATLATSDDCAIRLAGMLWDEPVWAKHITASTLWAEEGDELVMLLGVWAQQVELGQYDAPMSDEQIAQIEVNGSMTASVARSCRNKGSASALSRMLSDLAPGIVQSIMGGSPEESESIAIGLIWHITGQCASKAMQDISRQSALGLVDSQDRERFIELRALRQQAINRTRTFD